MKGKKKDKPGVLTPVEAKLVCVLEEKSQKVLSRGQKGEKELGTYRVVG